MHRLLSTNSKVATVSELIELEGQVKAFIITFSHNKATHLQTFLFPFWPK